MSKVIKGRMSAELEGDFVVFLIGMRINKPWKLHKWVPVARAMNPMLRVLSTESARARSELARPAERSQGDTDLGLLGFTSWYSLNGPLLVQYWRSFEHLEQFARNSSLPHISAWRDYNRRVGIDGDVGVWHETYQVSAGRFETIYANMPMIGLMAVGTQVPVRRVGDGAGERISRHSSRGRAV
jgi:hypothetical protein